MNRHETILEIRSTVSIVDLLHRMGVAPAGRRQVATTSLGLSAAVPSCIVTISPETPERSWQTADGRLGGDVVDLVRTVTGASLEEALALLALGGPISIASADRGPERRRGTSPDAATPVLGRTPVTRVQAVNKAAWDFYTDGAAASRARRRLVGWGVLSAGLEVIERRTGRAAAGHTPLSSTGLLDHLEEKGFCRDEIVDAGWASQRTASADLVDRYRNRVLLPYVAAAHGSDPRAVIGASGTSFSWAAAATHPRIVDHEPTASFRASQALYQPGWEPPVAHVVVVTSTAVDSLAIAAAAAAAEMDDRVTAVHLPSPAAGPALADLMASSGCRVVAARAGGVQTATEPDVVALPLGLSPLDWLRSEGTRGLGAFVAAASSAQLWPEVGRT